MIPPAREPISQRQAQARPELPGSLETELEQLLESETLEQAQALRRDWQDFKQLHKRFFQRETLSVQWDRIFKPPQEAIQAYETLQARALPEDVSSLLNKLVVVKLNGGLGTSMGVQGPKGLMEVRDDNTFLDLTIQQIATLPSGQEVIRLETAAGSAIGSFARPRGVNVPRSRFLPVKTTSDLLLVKSNLYELRGGALEMSERREFKTVPLVKLGAPFTKVQDLRTRFENIPDLLDLDHLTVSGDVTFGKDVVLKGTVIIISNHGSSIAIPSGSILENRVVSGNLSVLDH